MAMKKMTATSIPIGTGKRRNFTEPVGPEVIAPTTAMAEVSRLSLTSYMRDPYFQVSRELVGESLYDPPTAESLAEFLLSDKEFDLEAVDVYEIIENSVPRLYLVHGFTRDGAYQIAGRKNIPAIVHKGFTRIEAYEYALKCNAKHGKPLTNADKWKRVRAAFLHYGFDISNAEIARKIERAVTERFVGTVRAQMDKEAAEEAAAAAGLDYVPDAPTEPTVRTVVRNGKVFTMQTSGIGKRKAVAPPAKEEDKEEDEEGDTLDLPIQTPPATFTVPTNGHYVGPLNAVAAMKDLVEDADDEDATVTLTISVSAAKYLREILAQDYDVPACEIKDELLAHNL